MADLHNPERYGECWQQYKIDAYAADMEHLKPFVVFSGGWAWHLLSPRPHPERKHAHDHKDVVIHCPKKNVGTALGMLFSMGYKKVPTKYDRHQTPGEFRRYEKVVNDGEHPPFRLTVVFFVGNYPILATKDGWNVVRPDVLLSFYGNIHSSDKAWAVIAATKLRENGEGLANLSGRGDLLACPTLDVYICTKCGWNDQFIDDRPITVEQPQCPLCGYTAFKGGPPTYRPITHRPIKEFFKKVVSGRTDKVVSL